jgi:hypothetical protein
MNYYLTDCVYIKDGKTFYEDGDKIKKINKSNWHNYLGDYGWTKLSLNWRKRLKEDHINSCFGVLDCGGDGDCLFHVLCESLNSEYLMKLRMPKYDVKTLRQLAASEINKENFSMILETYKLDYEDNMYNFSGEWDPEQIKTIGQLKKEIIKGGDNFWGDHILLQLIQKKLKLNVIILNSSDGPNDKCTIHPLASIDFENNDKTIIIYYLDQYHFQLIGYFDGNIMNPLLKKNEIPQILIDIYNNDCRII